MKENKNLKTILEYAEDRTHKIEEEANALREALKGVDYSRLSEEYQQYYHGIDSYAQKQLKAFTSQRDEIVEEFKSSLPSIEEKERNEKLRFFSMIALSTFLFLLGIVAFFQFRMWNTYMFFIFIAASTLTYFLKPKEYVEEFLSKTRNNLLDQCDEAYKEFGTPRRPPYAATGLYHDIDALYMSTLTFEQRQLLLQTRFQEDQLANQQIQHRQLLNAQEQQRRATAYWGAINSGKSSLDATMLSGGYMPSLFEEYHRRHKL